MIEDLKEEGKVVLTCLITKADIGRTPKNAPYLSLWLEDSTGVLDAKYWNLNEEQAKLYKPGMIVEVVGDLMRYRNAWQLRVRSIEEVEGGDPTEYVRSAPLTRQEMETQINALIEDMKNPTIKEVTKELLELKKQDYYTYPAAVRNHHNFPGGLAWHSLSMAKLAKEVLGQYPWLDYDLLIAGTILHDLAKTEEYSRAILPEYTPVGNLLGHISIGTALIDRVAVALDVENSEEVMLLKHMVLSHHGKHEFGSPVLPMIPEAEVLTLLDNLDSRLFMIHQMLETVEPGCFGPRNFALDNRMFYRKTWEKDSIPLKTKEDIE
ncbi:MAG: HD domain-containing protein [Allobaculum sp.]|nr:HD domain-containing protein [Allobaculum sp.]